MRLTAQQRAKKEKKAGRQERVALREAERAARPVQPEVTVSPYEGKPFYECRVADSLFAKGMGPVFVARQLSGDRLAVAAFLVDAYCLGVKDAFIRRVGGDEYRWMRDGQRTRSVSPEHAGKLIRDAVAYAASLGLTPHPDYHRASAILAGVDADLCTETFTFGHDGKPLYIAGPHDTPARQARILRALEARQGADAFHYIVAI